MNLKYNPKLSYSKFMDLKRNDLGRISKIFVRGIFEPKIDPVVDNAKLGETADPHNIYRDCIRDEFRNAASEARDSEKSKGEAGRSSAGVHPAKELDEQLEKLFSQQTTSDSLASLAAFRNSSRMLSRYIL